MVYSEAVDGVFCIACAVLCADPSKGKFVVQPFRLWHKKGEKVKAHEHCALRGDAEDIESPGNPGNFLALLKLLAVHDDKLRKHLEAPALRCATGPGNRSRPTRFGISYYYSFLLVHTFNL